MMAKVEILQALPHDHEDRAAVLRTFADHAAALLKVQGMDGRWHQILDQPDTYLETSATAMFVRAFAAGVANGWLPEEPFAASAERGWAGMTAQISALGDVEGITRGTPIFFGDAQYKVHPTRTNDPRGLGAVLYATVAVDQMRKAIL